MAQIGGDGLHFESSIDNESLNEAIEESIKRFKGLSKTTTDSGKEMDQLFKEISNSVRYAGNAIGKTAGKAKNGTKEFGDITVATNKAGSGFDKVGSSASKAGSEFDKAGVGGKKAGGVFQEVGHKSTVLDRELKQLAATIATIFTVHQASQFVKDIISVRGEIESLEVSFETLVGNKKVAQEMFQSIREFAVNTPMQMNDLAKGAQTMLSFNIAAEDIMPNLKMLGDVSMGNTDKFNSLILAFSQITSAGHLMGQDFNQLVGQGFNPLTVISEKTGKSFSVLKEEMSQGAISADMVKEALKEVTSEGGKFYDMLNKQSTTLNGAISNLQGSITDMMNDIGEANEGAIRGAVDLSTMLVKNYKAVGATLEWLIVTYGSYRAALALSIAADKAKASSTTVLAIAQGKLSKAIKAAMLSMKAANATLLSNPIYLVVAAVASLAYGLYKLKKAEDEEAEARVKMISDLEDEETKLDSLKESIDATVRGTNDRKEAIMKLQSAYPSYLKNMLTEKSTAEEVSVAYQQLKRDVIDARLEQMKQSYMDEPLADLNNHKNSALKYASSALNNDYNLTNEQKGEIQGKLYKKINRAIDNGDKLYSGLLSAIVQEVVPSAKADTWAQSSGNFSRATSAINRDINALKIAKNQFNSFTSGFKSDDNTPKGINSKKSFKQLDDDLIKSQGELNKLKEEGSTIDAGVLKDAEAKVVASKKSVIERENELKIISGVASRVKELKKAQQGTVLNSTEYNDYAKRLEKLQAKISNPTKSKKKTTVTTEEESMRDYLAKYGTYQEKKLAISQQYDAKINAASDKWAAMSIQSEKTIALNQLDDTIAEKKELEDKKLKDLLVTYSTYFDKRKALEETFNKQILLLKSTSHEKEAEVAEKAKQAALLASDEAFAKKSGGWNDFINKISHYSIDKLKDVLYNAQTQLNGLSGDNAEDSAILRAKIAELQDEINSMSTSSNNEFNLEQWEALDSQIERVAMGFTDLGNSVGGSTGDVLKSVGTFSMGITSIISGMVKFSSVSASSIKGVSASTAAAMSAIEKASIILAILQTAIQLMKELDSILPTSDNEYDKYNAKIESVNKLVDAQNQYTLSVIKSQNAENEWFGNNKITELSDLYNLGTEAMKSYYSKLEEEQAIYENKSGGGFTTNLYNSVLKVYDKIYGTSIFGSDYDEGTTDAIDNLRIETRHKSSGFLGSGIGGHGQKTEDLKKWTRANLGFNLFDNNNMLNEDAYDAIMDKYANKLVGETKSTLEELKALKDKYDEYIDSLRSYVSDMQSPVIDAMVDATWEFVLEGKNAMDSLTEYYKDEWNNLGKDMLAMQIQNDIFNTKDSSGKTAADRMTDLMENYISGELSAVDYKKSLDKERANQEEKYKENSEKYNTIATSFGTKDSSQSVALSGTQISASEETVSAANGQMNAIRINQIEMKNAMNNQLAALNRIATNTSYNKHLETINTNIAKLSSNSSSQSNVNLRSTGKQL